MKSKTPRDPNADITMPNRNFKKILKRNLFLEERNHDLTTENKDLKENCNSLSLKELKNNKILGQLAVIDINVNSQFMKTFLKVLFSWISEEFHVRNLEFRGFPEGDS